MFVCSQSAKICNPKYNIFLIATQLFIKIQTSTISTQCLVGLKSSKRLLFSELEFDSNNICGVLRREGDVSNLKIYSTCFRYKQAVIVTSSLLSSPESPKDQITNILVIEHNFWYMCGYAARSINGFPLLCTYNPLKYSDVPETVMTQYILFNCLYRLRLV